MGIETYNDNLLKVLDKTFTLKDIDRALTLLFKSNIHAYLSIILGGPGETKLTLEKTTKFINKWQTNKINANPFLKIQLSVMTPVPGSQLYEIFKSRNGTQQTQKIIQSKHWAQKIQSRYLELFFDQQTQIHIINYYNQLKQIATSSYI